MRLVRLTQAEKFSHNKCTVIYKYGLIVHTDWNKWIEHSISTAIVSYLNRHILLCACTDMNQQSSLKSVTMVHVWHRLLSPHTAKLMQGLKELYPGWCHVCHDGVPKQNKMAMLVSQTSPVGAELFSYVNDLICIAACWPHDWKHSIG